MFIFIAIVLFVAAEFLIGWWALPVVALVLGLVGARRRGIGLQLGAAALAAWALLFGWAATHGDLPRFATDLALSMKLQPGQLIIAVTVLPAALAAAAGGLGAGVRNLMQPARSGASA